MVENRRVSEISRGIEQKQENGGRLKMADAELRFEKKSSDNSEMMK